MDLIGPLNHDFHKYLTEITSMLTRLNSHDKVLVVKWISELKKIGNTIEEAKLRNDFMYFLLQNVYNGKKTKPLDPPFNENPPAGLIHKAQYLLANFVPHSTRVYEEKMDLKGRDYVEPVIKPPSSGSFLIGKPVAQCGAFCYLTVVNRLPPETD